MSLNNVKANLAHIVELLSVADIESDPEEIRSLIYEATAFAHDAFMILDEYEDDEYDFDEENEYLEADEREKSRRENPSYFTKKQERQYEAIKNSVLDRGGSLPEAKRIAAATVNRDRGRRR